MDNVDNCGQCGHIQIQIRSYTVHIALQMSTTYSPYTKLFHSILDSTIWTESLPTKIVWITLLAMTDKDGRVWASVPGLANRAGVSIAECEEALNRFRSPDVYSRTKDHEGRRITEIDGGWMLLNHGKYKAMMSAEERREYKRMKQAEYRRKKKAVKNGPLPFEISALKAISRGDDVTADHLAAQRDETL